MEDEGRFSLSLEQFVDAWLVARCQVANGNEAEESDELPQKSTVDPVAVAPRLMVMSNGLCWRLAAVWVVDGNFRSSGTSQGFLGWPAWFGWLELYHFS